MVKQTITMKVRLYPSKEQSTEFIKVTKEYQRLCNIVSQWYFDCGCRVTRKDFQKDMYFKLRSISKLNSMMVQCVFRTVDARYKAVNTQLSKRPYHFKDINTNNWYNVSRDITWLESPIKFSRPQADYLRSGNYSFVNQGKEISLNVLGKRIKVKYNDNYLPYSILSNDVKLGTAKLVNMKGHWFFHIPVTREVSEWDRNSNNHIVGIDRGLRQIMTVYDESGTTKFFNGRSISYKRKKFAYLRRQLQTKNTKSAKRKLKKLGRKENRWMSDINHQLSKTLIDLYGPNTLFVLEDLTNVTFNKFFGSKDKNRDLRSWSFYDLQAKLEYKAQEVGSKVITVSAQYTSQRCPKCGQINKDNRNHRLHLYRCDHCGFTTNDDRIGAMNLYDLGKQYLIGKENPKINKANAND